MALAVVLVAAFLGAVSCGGSSGSSVTQPIASPGTTPGAYTVTVSGVAGSVTRTTRVSLTVS